MRAIFSKIDQLDLAGLSSAQKSWVVRAVSGAVMADGVLSPGERPHLASLYHLIKGQPELEELITETLATKRPMALEPLELEPSMAIKVYQATLDICSSDLALHPHEVSYLLKLADLLSLSRFEARRMLKFTLQMMRIEYLLEMAPMLELNERAWLATAIVRLIWADGVVEQRETEFLSHLYHLLEDDPARLEQMRKNPGGMSFEALAPPKFGADFSERVLQYLIEMTIEGNRLEPFGLGVVREAGVLLGRSKQRIEEMIQTTSRFLAL